MDGYFKTEKIDIIRNQKVERYDLKSIFRKATYLDPMDVFEALLYTYSLPHIKKKLTIM